MAHFIGMGYKNFREREIVGRGLNNFTYVFIF